MLATRAKDSSGRMETPTISSGVVMVVLVCMGTGAEVRTGWPERESMRVNSCLSGCMMRPACWEQSR